MGVPSRPTRPRRPARDLRSPGKVRPFPARSTGFKHCSLRQNASRYLRLVRKGQRVGVTDRGVLVAYLVPADSGVSVIDRLAAAGEYSPPVGSILDVPPPPPTPEGQRPLTDVLEEMRDRERW